MATDLKSSLQQLDRAISQFDGLFALRDVVRDLVNAEAQAEQAEERRNRATAEYDKLQTSLQSATVAADIAITKLEADHEAAVQSMNAEYDRVEASRRADHAATMKDLGDQLTDTKRSLESEQAKLAEVSSDRQVVQNELAGLTAQLNHLKQSVSAVNV